MEAKQRTRTSASNVYIRWNACSARARAIQFIVTRNDRRMHKYTLTRFDAPHTHVRTYVTTIFSVCQTRDWIVASVSQMFNCWLGRLISWANITTNNIRKIATTIILKENILLWPSPKENRQSIENQFSDKTEQKKPQENQEKQKRSIGRLNRAQRATYWTYCMCAIWHRPWDATRSVSILTYTFIIAATVTDKLIDNLGGWLVGRHFLRESKSHVNDCFLLVFALTHIWPVCVCVAIFIAVANN